MNLFCEWVNLTFCHCTILLYDIYNVLLRFLLWNQVNRAAFFNLCTGRVIRDYLNPNLKFQVQVLGRHNSDTEIYYPNFQLLELQRDPLMWPLHATGPTCSDPTSLGNTWGSTTLFRRDIASVFLLCVPLHAPDRWRCSIGSFFWAQQATTIIFTSS
jgi:hypothetical protein